jgi:hypothetical protein
MAEGLILSVLTRAFAPKSALIYSKGTNQKPVFLRTCVALQRETC